MKKYLNWAAWILLSFILTWMVRCAVKSEDTKQAHTDPAEALIKYHDHITHPDRYMDPSK